MLPERRMFEDEVCPVPDEVLGDMYRASAHGLNELIASVPPTVRGMLAIYCYRRAHLASIALAIAATCDEDDLTLHGGNAGTLLFSKSREAPVAPRLAPNQVNRRRITLASGTLRNMMPVDEEAESADVVEIAAVAEVVTD